MRKLYCLIGDPVEHSVSPDMFNAAFRAGGFEDHLYVAMRVGRRELISFVKSSRLMGLGGFNVTIPHKMAVADLVDSLDRSAEEVGAVNTVKISRDSLRGFNTDVMAIQQILPQEIVRGSQATVLGVGGAARAAAVALKKLGCLRQVYVGRRRSRLADMARFAEDRGIDYMLTKFNSGELSKHLGASAVIVNATPVGMHPKIDATPILPQHIKRGSLIFDMVYNPPTTTLLRNARKRGAVTIGGLEMLVAQAVESYKIWLGSNPDPAVMRRAAASGLRRYRR
ncbi:MAG: shikimate dehydrogenase [Nitrososphaerota archaeon]